MVDNHAIGRRIAEERKLAGLTQEEVAKHIKLNVEILDAIEQGIIELSTEMLIDLCWALNASADYLVFGKEESRENRPLQNLLMVLSKKELDDIEKQVECYTKKQEEN